MRQKMRGSFYFSLLVVTCLLLVLPPWPTHGQGGPVKVTVFEGARLITGDGGAPIENSAFIVENNLFIQVGRKGQVAIPAGALHVDLTGKTVTPGMTDMHGHFGYQDAAKGTMSKEDFTVDNLIDHMERLAYNGVAAAVGIGDLEDRSNLHGGRTNWGSVPLQVRDMVVPNAALFKTAGTGLAYPEAGAQGDPSRADVMYPVSTVAEVRAAVDDYVKMKPEFIKIWVDTRGGTKTTLSPELYLAVLDEAHRLGVPVGAHTVTLADAKQEIRGGMEGFLHIPVRSGDVVDDEVLSLVKQRVANNDRPNMWMTPTLSGSWLGTQGGARPAALDDPLLRDQYSPAQIEAYWGDPLKKMTPEQVQRSRKEFDLEGNNAMKLRAAGIKIVTGTDTGQNRFFIGYYNQLELEGLVAIGMTPSEAIVAATRDAAAVGHFNTGMVAAGKSADFIVLNANPLDNISNMRRINKVYLRGQEVDRAALKAKWQAKFGQFDPRKTQSATQ
jgi:imidazolonepropionase-like amidohydrolase